MVPLAARRQKRGLAATVTSAGGSSAEGATGGGDAGDGGGASSKRAKGGGSGSGGRGRVEAAGGVAGFEGGVEFVCTGCKMAARRAVRQYGLLGALETGGLVLPYGESDVSDE